MTGLIYHRNSTSWRLLVPLTVTDRDASDQSGYIQLSSFGSNSLYARLPTSSVPSYKPRTLCDAVPPSVPSSDRHAGCEPVLAHAPSGKSCFYCH